jgi:ribosomal protein S6--L-glutamate ligase
VDLLPRPGGWYVLEVNAVLGWRALAPVAGVDVAAELVRFLAGAGPGDGPARRRAR